MFQNDSDSALEDLSLRWFLVHLTSRNAQCSNQSGERVVDCSKGLPGGLSVLGHGQVVESKRMNE